MQSKIYSIAALAIAALACFSAATVAAAQGVTVHTFNAKAGDGGWPPTGLISDPAGNFYGATTEGGTYGVGSIFEFSPAAGGGWNEAVLYSFNNDSSKGRSPWGLVIDAAGNLYGATQAGATYGCGNVFELSPSGDGSWSLSVLYNFKNNEKDGNNVVSTLIFDSAGNLYGTAQSGGTYNAGVVFELTPTVGGAWAERIIHTFGNGQDGKYPLAGLVLDGAGNLYGTTDQGGANLYYGVVYELTPASGGGWKEKILHSFGTNNNGAGGQNPLSPLIFDTAGNLYGTTCLGGAYNHACTTGSGCGTVFELEPQAGGAWKEKVIHSFGANNADGVLPRSGVVLDAAGNLFGTTSNGGKYGISESVGGIAFELKPAGGGLWRERVLHSFGNGTDGNMPLTGSLLLDGTGNVFGTAYMGGSLGWGTIFEITP